MNTTLTDVFKLPPIREKIESVRSCHPVTGIITYEEFRRNNRLSRDDGPACIWRDSKTGFVIGEQWWSNGKLDRKDGPASIRRDGATGMIIIEEWWSNGKKFEAPPSLSLQP